MINLKELDYNHLNSFYHLVTHRSIEKVSKQFGMSELTLRRQIKKLEEELGVTLLTSKKGFITCTKEAEQLYHNLKIFFENLEDILSSHHETFYRVGFSDYIGELFCSQKIAELKKSVKLRLEFYFDSIEELVTKLHNGQLDVIYTFNIHLHDKEIEYLPLETLEIGMVELATLTEEQSQECYLINPCIGFADEWLVSREFSFLDEVKMRGKNRLAVIEAFVRQGKAKVCLPKGFYDCRQLRFDPIVLQAPFIPLQTQLIFKPVDRERLKKIIDFFDKNLINEENRLLKHQQIFFPR